MCLFLPIYKIGTWETVQAYKGYSLYCRTIFFPTFPLVLFAFKKIYIYLYFHFLFNSPLYASLAQVPPSLETSTTEENLETTYGISVNTRPRKIENPSKLIVKGVLLVGTIVCLSQAGSSVGAQLAMACILKKLTNNNNNSKNNRNVNSNKGKNINNIISSDCNKSRSDRWRFWNDLPFFFCIDWWVRQFCFVDV